MSSTTETLPHWHVLFTTEDEANAACAARNQAGGFYSVRDLSKDPHPDFPGETGFAVLWDSDAAAAWRRAYLRSMKLSSTHHPHHQPHVP